MRDYEVSDLGNIINQTVFHIDIGLRFDETGNFNFINKVVIDTIR